MHGVLLALTAMVAGEPVPPRNVLLLVADDLGRTMGCYGDRTIRTPNLDAFARSAVHFTHAFATTASCSPSRSVLYTGLHNHANGMYGLQHAEHNFAQRPQVQTVFSLLKSNKYRTGLIGKKHVGPDKSYPLDFEPRVNPRNPAQVARQVVEFLSGAGDQPFFLVVGFTDPHRAAVGFANDGKFGDHQTVRYDPSTLAVPPFLPDEPPVRADLAEYAAAVSRLDDGVGRVLKALDASGKSNNTLVIFLSDNGIPFPGAKTTVYDAGIHLPLLVRDPNQQESAGKRCQAMVSWVDITPTILDWAGVKPLAAMHGRSLMSILGNEQPPDWDEVYASHTFHEVTMYYPMRAVRTRRHKLIWNLAHPLPFPFASDLYNSPSWQCVLTKKLPMMGQRPTKQFLKRPEFELYDLENDPHEVKNLTDDPAMATVRSDLLAKLRRFRRQTNDPWDKSYH